LKHEIGVQHPQSAGGSPQLGSLFAHESDNVTSVTMLPPGISTALILELNYDTPVALAGTADMVVQEYLEAYPQHTEAVIKPFRVARQWGFEECERVQKN
jgi:hypothetical protein